jgi:hypothetical protein
LLVSQFRSNPKVKSKALLSSDPSLLHTKAKNLKFTSKKILRSMKLMMKSASVHT